MMKINQLPAVLTSVALILLASYARGQEAEEDNTDEPSVTERAEGIVKDAREKADEFSQHVNESETAQETSAGILQPIYALAEYLSFPTFHWFAFAVMVTGAVSFALQLFLGKLALLFRMGLSLTEIISDAFGLLICLVGLVLTTQAVTENSNFTKSPAAVISAVIIGLVVGFVLYRWGQSQEVQALEGRKVQAAQERAKQERAKKA